MYAVVAVSFPSPLDPQSLFAAVPRIGTVDECIAMSRFSNAPEVGSGIVYWNAGATGLTIVFCEGLNALQAHVENRQNSSCMAQLKLRAEGALRMISDAAKHLTLTADSHRIEIYAEDTLIQVGTSTTFLGYVQKQFSEKILSQCLQSFAVALGALLVSQQPGTATGMFFVAFVTLFVRTCLEASFFRKAVTYVDA